MMIFSGSHTMVSYIYPHSIPNIAVMIFPVVLTGYMNVLPADVMKRQMRARTVIAVDVSQVSITGLFSCGP